MIAALRGRLKLDGPSGRLVRNVSRLLSAQAASALIGVVTLGVAARALGPVGLGAFALVEAYVRAVDRFCRPEPWQAVIAYGAAPLEGGDDARFGRLLRFGVALDVGGALLASAVAAGFASVIGPSLGLSDTDAGLAAAAGLMLLASVSSTALAALRLLDQFAILAKLQVWASLLRLGLTLAAAVLEGGVGAFVAVMAATHVFEHLATVCLAARELRRRGRLGPVRHPMRGVFAENPGLARFLLTSNLTVVLRQSTQRFDVLILGALTGVEQVGFYQLAKRIGLAMLKFARPLQQAIYPEFARLWARGETRRFRRLAFGAAGGLGFAGFAGAAAVAPFMNRIIAAILGPEFASAAPVVIMQLLAVAMFLSGVGIGPALLAAGRSHRLVAITGAGAALFFLALRIGAPAWGALAGAAAHVLANATVVTASAAVLATASGLRGAARRFPNPAAVGDE